MGFSLLLLSFNSGGSKNRSLNEVLHLYFDVKDTFKHLEYLVVLPGGKTGSKRTNWSKKYLVQAKGTLLKA